MGSLNITCNTKVSAWFIWCTLTWTIIPLTIYLFLNFNMRFSHFHKWPPIYILRTNDVISTSFVCLNSIIKYLIYLLLGEFRIRECLLKIFWSSRWFWRVRSAMKNIIPIYRSEEWMPLNFSCAIRASSKSFCRISIEQSNHKIFSFDWYTSW